MSAAGESDKFVTLIASFRGRKPVRRPVRKDVIQSESSFLRGYIEDGATEIKILLKRPKNLNVILEYLYEGQLNDSTQNHLKSLWNDARILGLVNLQKVCIERLTDAISLDSWIEILAFSQAEGCHELESNVLSFVNENFEDCSSSPSFTSLSVDQMVQVLQLPTVKTTVKEADRVVLILDWIKANEVDRCCQAHRLLEQVDLMNLTENSVRSFFDEESAFSSWRSVAIFERAIRLKKIQEAATHSETVSAQSNESESVEAGPAVFESLDNRPTINIKQEVASEESSSDARVNESNEAMNPKDSGRECRMGVKQEVTSPLASSICESVENNEDDLPPPKMPRLEYSQNENESVIPSQPTQIDFVSKQKQILYFSQLSNGAKCLTFVTISAAGAISKPQQALPSLPNYVEGVPKLIWNQEARNLCFLGYCGGHGFKVPFLNFMNGEGAPKVTVLPKLFPRRHNHQPVLLNGCVYVFGGSKSVICKNNDRLCSAEVLDMTTPPWVRWQWQPIASTATKRDLYAAACVQGNIYVTGGAIDRPTKSEPLITNHALCYEPKQNRWKYLNPMQKSRCGHALAVLGHKIYVFGGSGNDYNDPSKDLVNVKSAEVYDVHENRWTLIAPMLRPRYGGSAVEIEGKIYVIGGDQSKEGESRSSVECYDPVTNSWNFVCETVDDQGLFDSITVIDDPECFLKSKYLSANSSSYI